MRVLVTGGRDYNNQFLIDMTIATLHYALPEHDMTLIVGDATGADTFARKAADSFKWAVEVFKADWDAHGKAAGPIRNKAMIEVGKPDICIAFPGGRGTQNCMKQAEQAGIPVHRVSTQSDVLVLLEVWGFTS